MNKPNKPQRRLSTAALLFVRSSFLRFVQRPFKWANRHWENAEMATDNMFGRCNRIPLLAMAFAFTLGTLSAAMLLYDLGYHSDMASYWHLTAIALLGIFFGVLCGYICWERWAWNFCADMDKWKD